MKPACDRCGTTDFAAGRAVAISFICPECRLIMCRECAGRSRIDGMPAFCCYHCGSTGIRDAEVWADRLTSRSSGPGRASSSS